MINISRAGSQVLPNVRVIVCQVVGACLLTLTVPGSGHAVFQTNGKNTCIDCHQNLEDERLSQPVPLWSASVHGEVGNTCDGCHGGDPKDPSMDAMSLENNFYAAPEKEDIVTFCGKCHQELSEYFMTSAHGQTHTQTCIDCHGTHTIRRISIDIINEDTCGACHDYDPALKLKKILLSLHQDFQARVNQTREIKWFPTEPVEKQLKDIWSKLRKVRMISHTFDVPRVQEEAEKVGAVLNQIDSEIGRLLELVDERETWGTATILIFLGLAILAYFYTRQVRDLD